MSAPREDIAQQALERVHERCGEGRGAVIVQFDPDRTGIDVRATSPAAGPGMPGASVFVHERRHAAVPRDQPVAGDFARRVAQGTLGGGRVGHGRVVENHQFGA